jgi:FimV-like protein
LVEIGTEQSRINPKKEHEESNVMAKKKTTRKDLVKGTDEFLSLSSRAVIFFNTHVTGFKYVGMGILVIAVVYLGINTYMSYVNKKGQNAYNVAYDTLKQNMKPGTSPEALKESEELFDKVIDEYSMSKAARLALPQVAYLKFADKKYDEAIALYEEFSEKIPSDGDFNSLTKLALAACYEAKGDRTTAIGLLNAVLSRSDDPFRETAMYSLALLYRSESQPEKAKEILKEFVDQYKTSPFLPMAKALL